jgi:hypothetical protein
MQVAEVWNLMKSWERDPCWDLENDAYDPKYAPYRQILLDFAKVKRAEWEKHYKEKEATKQKVLSNKTCPIMSAGCPENIFFCLTDDCALWDKLSGCRCFKSYNGGVKI